jgi:hypothetical protein
MNRCHMFQRNGANVGCKRRTVPGANSACLSGAQKPPAALWDLVYTFSSLETVIQNRKSKNSWIRYHGAS